MGAIPGSGRSLGVNGNPLQYSCLGNPIERGAWRATAHGAAELDTTERLINHATLLSGLRSSEFKSENSGDGWSEAESDWRNGGGTILHPCLCCLAHNFG